ncbi:unnamed protein product [Caenorhabditis auriculariae]|uniref:Uncharacterized protein n=1 Tax=Caenorhabditis auriculariae TaxID=2777116 RepID=A0A8S1GTZ1_9PELO|nr:unnamed protein product [Caenorhabditis auriculariae]
MGRKSRTSKSTDDEENVRRRSRSERSDRRRRSDRSRSRSKSSEKKSTWRLTEMARSLFASSSSSKIPEAEGSSQDIQTVDPEDNVYVPFTPFPPFETFVDVDRESARRKFEEESRVGDVLYVKVLRCDVAGAYVKPLCYAKRLKRDLEWLRLELPILQASMDRRVKIDDIIRVGVLSTNPPKYAFAQGAASVAENELPEFFREARKLEDTKFREFANERPDRCNPYLASQLGVSEISLHSFLFSPHTEDISEPASSIRKKQDNLMAENDVNRGISEMKSGNSKAALVLFDDVISKFPEFVDAYVSRGALHWNMGDYWRAERDLKKAIEMQPDHPNAKTYLIETLISYAKTFEVKEDWEEAKAKYESVLRHREDRRARSGLKTVSEKIERRKRNRSPSAEIVGEMSAKDRKKIRAEDREKRRSAQERERELAEREKERAERNRRIGEFEKFFAGLRK